MPPRAKRTEYAVAVDRAGHASSEGRSTIEVPDDWTPEHLVLAGLADCILTSLSYHARRAGIEYAADASATGAVMLREDGRWGFVELHCAVDLETDARPGTLALLVEASENGCFIGASLSPRPDYRWRVNGADYSY